MIRFALAALIVAAALSPNLRAAPKPPALSFQSAAAEGHIRPFAENLASASPAVRPPPPSGSGVLARPRREMDRPESRPVRLSYSQKQALVEAWRAGYHVGLPLAFAAVVYVESSGCQTGTGDGGLAFGCSQVHEAAAYAATGIRIPPSMLSDPLLRELNMAVAARYLQMCVEKFGWPAGVGCYTTGLPRATAKGKRYLENLDYTRAVLAAMKWLRGLPRDTE